MIRFLRSAGILACLSLFLSAPAAQSAVVLLCKAKPQGNKLLLPKTVEIFFDAEKKLILVNDEVVLAAKDEKPVAGTGYKRDYQTYVFEWTVEKPMRSSTRPLPTLKYEARYSTNTSKFNLTATLPADFRTWNRFGSSPTHQAFGKCEVFGWKD